MGTPKSDIIHIGVVGLGPRGAKAWVPLLNTFKDCRIVAVSDHCKPLVDDLLANHPDRDIKGYTDYAEMLEHPGLDAVVINTDATTQVDLAVQAMEAGKHVTTEVPACNTLEDCWKLVLATERTGRVYQLAEQMRYAGFFQAWRQMVASGQLGKILYVEGEYVGFYHPEHPFYFRDEETGQRLQPEEAVNNPRAQKTWRHNMNVISYLPHTLSPLLMVIDDRVTEVTAMGTRPQSYFYENVEQSDIEVALMKTEKDSVLRVMTGFASPVGKRGENIHHVYTVRGTHGALESQRCGWDKQKMWLYNHQMTDWAAMPWSLAVTDAPQAARESGHGGMDYYPVSTWFDAIRGKAAPAMDVYTSVETAAPAAAAIESIRRGSTLVKVPDFRPNASRAPGEEPKTRGFEA